MIIISQDKEKIVNFSNIQEMNIEEWSTMKEGKVIWFYVINAEKSKDYQTEIGRYSTKERAKEVLQEIIKLYNEEDIYHIRKSELNSLDSLEEPKYIIKQVAIPKVYKMPKE